MHRVQSWLCWRQRLMTCWQGHWDEIRLLQRGATYLALRFGFTNKSRRIGSIH